MTDPYTILGLNKDADEAAIKRAYRKIAKETHPDMHPDDEACLLYTSDAADEE